MATKQDIQDWQRLDVTKEFMEYVEAFKDEADNDVHADLRQGNLESASMENAAKVQLEEVLDIPDRMITEAEKAKEAEVENET